MDQVKQAEEKLLALHAKCKTLNSSECIFLIIEFASSAKKNSENTDMILKIMKTYLFRALQKEGYR